MDTNQTLLYFESETSANQHGSSFGKEGRSVSLTSCKDSFFEAACGDECSGSGASSIQGEGIDENVVNADHCSVSIPVNIRSRTSSLTSDYGSFLPSNGIPSSESFVRKGTLQDVERQSVSGQSRQLSSYTVSGPLRKGRRKRTVPNVIVKDLSIYSKCSDIKSGHGQTFITDNVISDERENILAMTDSTLKQHKDRKVYVKTRAFDKAIAKLTVNPVLIISGFPGDGKTVLGYEILNFFRSIKKDDVIRERKIPVILNDPSDWNKVVNPKDDVVVFLDNVFGSIKLNRAKVENLEKVLDNIWSCVGDRSGSVLVVMSARKYILKEFQSIKDVSSFNRLFDVRYQIDISMDTELMLNRQIKTEMLRKHILEPVEGQHHQIQICTNRTNENFIESPFKISEETIQEIASMHCVKGFPFCCKLFVQNEDFIMKGKKFFKQPFQWLIELFDSFYTKEKMKYLLLVCILYSGDSGLNRQLLNPTDLTDPISSGTASVELCFGQMTIQMLHRLAKIIGAKGYETEMQETEKFLQETLVSTDNENEIISFSHDVIHEAMSLSFGRKFPDLFAEGCSIDLLLKYVHIDRRDSCMILVKKPSFCKLVGRFIREIEHGHTKEVLTHEAFDNEAFTEIFVDTVKRQRDRDPEHYSDFLQMGMGINNDKCKTRQGILFFAVDREQPIVHIVKFILANPPIQYIHSLCLPKTKTPDWFKSQKSVALWAACKRGYFEIYKLFWEAKTNVSLDSLVDAAKADSGKIIKHFITEIPRSKFAAKEQEALVIACEYGNRSAFDALWQRVKIKNTKMLLAACRGGNEHIVEEVAKGQDVNQVENGITALHEATSRGHQNVVTLLVQKGARKSHLTV